MDYAIIPRERRDLLGEGPLWCAGRGMLLWVDILAPALHQLDLAGGETRTFAFDEPIGWVAERAGRADFVVGLQSGFAELSLDPFRIEPIGDPEPDRPGNRFNDAKVDRWGRIWAGTKDDSGAGNPGALYRLDHDKRWARCDDGYGVTNGPAFSRDGRILFHTDSDRRTIYAFDLGDDGSIANKREHIRFADDWGYPDGMTGDADGCLWVAHWDGGRISRFDPEGQLERSIALPASRITSCCFGGPDLDRLFVTSAALDRPAEPLAGALFELVPGVRGVAPSAFGG